jgi:periplasmic copper chaperone A
VRQGPPVRAFRPEEGIIRVCRRRLIEIGIAVALTTAAVLFVAWAVWAARGGIHVTDAWARPTIGQGRVAAAYMTITNAGEGDDALVGVTSPKAEKVEMHQTKMGDDGVMRMRPVEHGIPVPAGGKVEFAPGGYHLMVMGLGEPLNEGSDLPLTLTFTEAGSVDLVVPVRGHASGGHEQH